MQNIQNNILIEIQKKRNSMIDLAQKKGFTNFDTIKCSQELDQLIYQYQKLFHEQSKPHAAKRGKINYMLA